MASIKKRESGKGVRWDAQVYVGRMNGRPKFVAKTFERKGDAEKWAREQHTLKDHGDRPSTTKLTLAEYLDQWLTVHAGQVRDVTIYNYRRSLTRWVIQPTNGAPPIGACRLSKLNVQQFDKLYIYMREAGIQPRGIRYLHSMLKRALKDAVRKGIVPKNAAEYATVPKADHAGEDDDERVQALDQQQSERFLAAARQDRLSALWHVLLLGMVRPCEAFALKWTDVDFEAGTIRVRRSLSRTGLDREKDPLGWKLTPPKTKKSRRTIPLPPVAIRELRAWKAAQARERLQLGSEYQHHGFVFTSETGTPLDLNNVCARPYRRVMAAAGLGEHGPQPNKPRSGPTARRPFTPSMRIYGLRHTGATLLLLAGESLKVVSERLGHASIVLTADTYSHVLPTMQQAAADKLEAMFGKG